MIYYFYLKVKKLKKAPRPPKGGAAFIAGTV